MINSSSIIKIKRNLSNIYELIVSTIRNERSYQYIANMLLRVRDAYNRLNNNITALIKLLIIVIISIVLYIFLFHMPTNYYEQQYATNTALKQDLNWLLKQTTYINSSTAKYGKVMESIPNIQELKKYYMQIKSSIIKDSQVNIKPNKQLNIVWKGASITETFRVIEMLHKRGVTILDFNYEKIGINIANTEVVLQI